MTRVGGSSGKGVMTRNGLVQLGGNAQGDPAKRALTPHSRQRLMEEER
jgi:hypothetical protein